MQQKISIMGCGWLGLPLAKALVAESYILKGSTTQEAKLAKLESLDILPYKIKAHPKPTGDALSDFFDTDILIITIPPKRKDPDVFKTYPNTIHHISKMADRAGVTKIIYLSSTSVYGNQSGLINEQVEPNPKTESGKSVLRVEHILKKLPQFKTNVIRLAGLYGPGRNPGNWFAGRKDVPDAKKPVNLIHQSDAVRLIVELIQQDLWGKTYNACSDEHPERASFYLAQTEKLGLSIPLFSDIQSMENYPIIDNSLVKKELNFSFSGLVF